MLTTREIDGWVYQDDERISVEQTAEWPTEEILPKKKSSGSWNVWKLLRITIYLLVAVVALIFWWITIPLLVLLTLLGGAAIGVLEITETDASHARRLEKRQKRAIQASLRQP